MFSSFEEWSERTTSSVDERRDLLPDPVRARRHHTIISVDDHVVEPPDAFVDRVPARYRDRAPRVVGLDGGGQGWEFDGELLPLYSFNAVAGRPKSTVAGGDFAPVSFDDLRPGTYDVDARVRDMDLDGVYASLNFPSSMAGFGGGRLQTTTKDLDLALAVVRAWNDWHLEGWAGAHPDRIIPCQIPWLHDPVLAAGEIRSNASRGFKAVTFPENPSALGFPSVHTPHWDPFLEACEETGTVICLHTGSGGGLPTTTDDAPTEVFSVLFGAYAVFPAVDWLYSFCGARFPALRLCLSEGGIGWVAGLMDRLEHSQRRLGDIPGGTPGPFPPAGEWRRYGVTPVEVFRRNFWFCALDDRAAFRQADLIGEDHILLEVDYPHGDTIWPASQAVVEESLRGLPAGLRTKITWQNAAQLFRHEVPKAVQEDPDAF